VNLVSKVQEYGLRDSVVIGWNRYISGLYLKIKHINAPIYQNPTPAELQKIEEDLVEFGISVNPIVLSKQEFDGFKSNYIFPDEYHGGKEGKVWDEKYLEHFIAYKFCDLDKFTGQDVYVDIAAAGSPWAKILHENGYKAYSIDLNINKAFGDLDFYIQSDAKKTNFEDSSVTACSLQCAYEMFNGDDDILFIDECKRILIPNGKAVISPLYMHTHHCGYSTIEYYRKGYSDNGATEYLRRDCWGIPFSRKYSAKLLRKRIIDRIEKLGMDYRLYKIENKDELGQGIYCHFFLVIKNQ
jgi:SAM-dependent methyltransferase